MLHWKRCTSKACLFIQIKVIDEIQKKAWQRKIIHLNKIINSLKIKKQQFPNLNGMCFFFGCIFWGIPGELWSASCLYFHSSLVSPHILSEEKQSAWRLLGIYTLLNISSLKVQKDVRSKSLISQIAISHEDIILKEDDPHLCSECLKVFQNYLLLVVRLTMCTISMGLQDIQDFAEEVVLCG